MAVVSGQMLVPRAGDHRTASHLLWVAHGAGGRGSQHGPAVVRQDAGAVARAAERVTSHVETLLAALSGSPVSTVDPVSAAAAQARSYAGGARAQLRYVLTQQAASVPPPLSAPRPTHPRLAPDGPVSFKGR